MRRIYMSLQIREGQLSLSSVFAFEGTMRLLNVHNLTFKTVDQTQDPTTGTQVPYVVISHRWLDNELTFQDMEDVAGFHKRSEDPSWAKSQSAAKLKGACNQVYVWSLARYGSEEHADFVHHVWLDTVCIDKKDPAELSEAINSMYRWYERATVCFVYVYDYQLGGKSLFSSCSWWERGWTLQELVAPVSSEFYDRNWTYFGNKIALSQEITNRTRISGNILSHMGNRKIVSDESIGRRMSWYADRKTAKGEDAAYCLMGLFRVNMPLLYGEGSKRAFRRLQEEILKYSDDHTLFAWVDVSAADDGKNPSSDGYGLLAPNPACFRTTGTFEQKETPGVDGDDRYGVYYSILSYNFPEFR
ncbi:heterokaryon incompatibility protein-domain-containing protein [Nemania sp. FL0916]|nr:heterokaryon incompatibility protein-domain-containing protein [Nemania sp. FL0916]